MGKSAIQGLKSTNSNFKNPKSKIANRKSEYGFTVASYDKTKDLIIDPLLASTFLGGSRYEYKFRGSLAMDTNGNVYVTGLTSSSDFPTTSGAYDTSWNGADADVFVSKLDGGLTSLLASTYLGGSSNDNGYSLVLDTSGHVYVTGYTESTNFPTTSGAYDTSWNGGYYDVFVSKLDGGLTSLLASTYLGGSGDDYGFSLVLDTSGNVYVTGGTYSADFPTTSGVYDTSWNGGVDVFISKLDGGLTSLLASTFLGGSGYEYASNGQGHPLALALDTSGNVYVTGVTSSANFPTTNGAYDTSFNGDNDVFVSKLDGNLSASAATTPTPSPTPSPTASPKPTPSPTITPKVDSLLEKYAPILYMHPDERYYPTKVETMLDNSKLIQKRQFSTITVYENKDNTLTLDMLMSDKYNTKKHYLKLKEKSLKKIKNKTYWRKKEKVVYGRQFEANDNGIEKIVLQYWFFYIYNDWGKKTDFANVHEGDWEMIQIIFGSDKQPLLITYSYHEGGETFLWEKDKDKIDKSNDGNHPKVYVTLGGHGCWNKAGNHAWYQELSGVCLDCEDETKKGDVLYPPNFPEDEIQTNYSKYPYILEDMSAWTEKDWIYWTGYWGNQADYEGFTGPPSPPYIDYIKDDEYEGRWKEPFKWGVAPLPGNYQVCSSNNSKIIVYDLNGNVMYLLKKCSPFVFTINSEKDLVFGIYSLDGEEVNLNISRFKRTTGEVYEVEFNNLEIPKNGKASLTFSPEQNPSLEIGIDSDMDGLFDSHRLPDYFEIK